MKFSKITVVVFAMFCCLTLVAQGPPGGGRGQGQRGGNQQRQKPDAAEILKMLDTNNDDKIDKDEASKDKRGKISEDFDEIDANTDGFIVLEELEASLNNKAPKKVSPKKLVKQIDDDSNGKLNELEVAAAGHIELSEKFSEIDTNKDSELDLDELKVFYNNDEKQKKRGK